MAKSGPKTKRAAAKSAAAETTAPEPAPEGDEPAILQRLEATPRWNGLVVAGGLMLVAGLSVFAIRGMRRRR